MSLKKIMAKMEADIEKKSWEKEETVTFQIGFKVIITNKRGYQREEWFWKEIVQESKKYPRGISEEDAVKMGARVYKKTTIRERLK